MRDISKLVGLVGVAILLLFSCEQKQEKEIIKSAVIEGTIRNHKSDTVLIKYSAYKKHEDNREAIILNNDYFSHQIPVDSWVLGKLSIANDEIFFFLEPGDTLKISSSLNELVFEGSATKNSTYFNESYNIFESREFLIDNRIKTTQLKSDKEFRYYRDSIRQKHMKFYESRKGSLSQKAKKIALAQIDYRWANKLFDYPTLHLFFNKRDLKPDFAKGYHSFIESCELNDSELLGYDKYTAYIDNYLDHQLKLEKIYNGLHYNHENSYDDYYKYKDLLRLTNEYLNGEVKDFMSAYYLQVAMNRGRYETVIEEYNRFINGSSNYLDSVIVVYNRTSRIDSGKRAPNFTLLTIEDKPVSLSDLKENIIYVDFWASWCKPCLQVMPKSNELRERFVNEKVEFLYVSLDENEIAWKKTVEKLNMGGINVRATKDSQIIHEEYGISALPRYMIIDKNGIIVDNDAMDPGNPRLEALISSLLDK